MHAIHNNNYCYYCQWAFDFSVQFMVHNVGMWGLKTNLGHRYPGDQKTHDIPEEKRYKLIKSYIIRLNNNTYSTSWEQTWTQTLLITQCCTRERGGEEQYQSSRYCFVFFSSNRTNSSCDSGWSYISIGATQSWFVSGLISWLDDKLYGHLFSDWYLSVDVMVMRMWCQILALAWELFWLISLLICSVLNQFNSLI